MCASPSPSSQAEKSIPLDENKGKKVEEKRFSKGQVFLDGTIARWLWVASNGISTSTENNGNDSTTVKRGDHT